MTDASLFLLQQAGLSWSVGGAAAAWGSHTAKSISSLLPFARTAQWIDDHNSEKRAEKVQSLENTDNYAYCPYRDQKSHIISNIS